MSGSPKTATPGDDLPALYERFTITYPSGTVVEAHYADGATLREVQVAHPMATVKVVEDSLIGVDSRA